MAVLGWGWNKLEITKSIGGAPAENADWKTFPEVKQGTAQLSVEAGEKVEAIDEKGDVVDTRTAKSKYTFECQIFVKKGDKKPISDEDGVIVDNYAVRLTPEDPTTEGFLMENTSVAVEETWSATDGKLLKYTFSGLKPKSGKICKPYVAEPAESEQGSSMEDAE